VTTATTQAPPQPPAATGRDSFGGTLRAEWAKFRTVRGWVIGMTVATIVTVLIGLLSASGSMSSCNGKPCHFVFPVGPGGEAVTDTFYFVHRPLASHGSITARVTSLTGELPTATGNGRVRAGQAPGAGMHPGLESWSKAGLIIKAGTAQGSAYAAVMVTGDHGVRMQYDYTQDIAGPPGRPTPASPRWLRLTRAGDTITGYASADGTHWTEAGTATLPGLPATVQAGLFATSPPYNLTTAQGLLGSSGTGGPTLASAVLDHVSLHGAAPRPWSGTQLGAGPGDASPAMPGSYHRAGGTFTVTGSGDIAPDAPGGAGPGQTLDHTLVGAFAGLIAVVVVAAMFVTAEYRRGLIRTTFAASPRRGQVLAAKAIVIAAVSFAAGLVAAVIAIPLNSHVLRANGNYLYPVNLLTQARMVAGTAGLLAVAAVLALALGTALRRSAIAVTVVIAAIILPFLVAVTNLLSPGADNWLMRLVPAAGFAVQQTIPSYPQVNSTCTVAQGCYPLAPWAGFAVLCAWAAAALGLALFLLRRRDA
jgi:ABC-type transport system involved in multi-copper enzyme maturation permease subunit